MSLNPPTGGGINILSPFGGMGGQSTLSSLLPFIGFFGLGYFNVLGGFIPWLGVSIAASAWLGMFLGNVIAGTPMSKAYVGANLSIGAVIWGGVVAFTGNVMYGMIASLLYLFYTGMATEIRG
jgi:hypothetical protein